jgi:hypothetical protein
MVFTFWAKNPTSSGNMAGSFKIKVYNDAGRVKLVSNTTVASSSGDVSSISSTYGFKAAYFRNYEGTTPTEIIQNEVGPFSFDLRFGSTVTASSLLEVTFPAGTSIPTGALLTCTIGSGSLLYSMSKCHIAVASPLKL